MARRRSIHGSLRRQAILMPAMSPLMTEGTITRWRKKEGEAFVAGDVLLQIESDIAMIDVEAHAPGILGKILMPDGTTNVLVEQVIALVATTPQELAQLLTSDLDAPRYNPIPTPPSTPPIMSSRSPITSPRRPSLFEMHSMGYGQRSVHAGGPRRPPIPIGTPLATHVHGEICPLVTPGPGRMSVKFSSDAESQLDGAAIRRMIVSNLASSRGIGNKLFDELV
jgi:pyruvate/2-oxoglutarate dehydrogenase complex dihydrolipoamide acyltransferase (E2) component